MIHFVLALVTFAIAPAIAQSLFSSGVTRDTYGKCEVKLEGHRLLRGPCDVEFFGENGERGFQIYVPGTDDWVAAVGGGQGVIDLPVASGGTQTTRTGKIEKKGACWINKKARICVDRFKSQGVKR